MISRELRIGLVMLAVATIWFVTGIWWGLPEVTPASIAGGWGSDEIGPNAAYLLRQALFGEAVSPSPQYPLGQYFVQSVFVESYRAVLAVLRRVGLPQLETTQHAVMLMHRLPSALMAAGTAVAAHTFVKWQSGDRVAALVAACAAATIGPLVFYARTSNVDMAATFWAALAMPAALRALQQGLTARRALFIGACAALGTAAKDQQYAFFFGLGVVLLVAHLARARREQARDWWRAPVAGLAAAAVIYLLFSGIVLLPGWFREHVRFILEGNPSRPELRALRGFYFSNPATLGGYLNVTGSVALQVLAAVGLPIALLALGGLVALGRRDRAVFALLAVPGLTLLLGVVYPVRFVLPRFLLPLDVLVCLAAGLGVAAARARGPAWTRAVGAVAVAGLAWSAVRAADLTVQMINDSRYEAAAWIARNVAPGDTVAYYGSVRKLPRLSRGLTVTPAPGQVAYGRDQPVTDTPSYIISIPQQAAERVHEWSVPDSIFLALFDSAGGYRQVLAIQQPALFARPLLVASYVNPPVRIFARHDVAGRLPEPPRIELPDPEPRR